MAATPATEVRDAARLEREGLVILKDHPFVLTGEETQLAREAHGDGRAKNISLAPGGGEVRGASGRAPHEGERLAALMRRYADWAEALVLEIAPAYRAGVARGRTSFRPRGADEPPRSVRKDDRRLHVDAFASQPTGGRRILRVFSNIDLSGGSRRWRVGEPFEAYARRWLERVRPPLPGEAWALYRLGITRARRSPYDFLMLGLHDRAKLDDAYQAAAPRREIDFPAGSTWVVFTDSVVHAAIAGRGALEQTFYLPVEAMAEPERSPLRILEGLTGRALARA